MEHIALDTIEEIVAVMRIAGERPDGLCLRALTGGNSDPPEPCLRPSATFLAEWARIARRTGRRAQRSG